MDKDGVDKCNPNEVNCSNSMNLDRDEMKPNVPSLSREITLCSGNEMLSGLKNNIKVEVEEVVEICKTEKDSNPEDVGSVNSKTSPNFTPVITKVNLSRVKVEVQNEYEYEEDSSQFVAVEETSCAFTTCQQPDSGTDDSESDSSESIGSADQSSGSESSSESEAQVLTTPQKIRNGNAGRRQAYEKPKKKIGLYKGELDLGDLPPIEDLRITVPKEECEPLGTICSIVNQLVVVESMENKPALNLDSLLFKKDGDCIGQIFDVFGPVKTPFYTLRFNTKEEVADKGVEVGQTVYCAPQTPHTKYVFVYQLMKQKGSDASWKHNYEVPDCMLDYSDDEEERRARRKHRQKTRDKPWQGGDHDSAQKVRPVVPEYNRYIGNEWYKARVADLNQLNRANSNPRLVNNLPQSQQLNFQPNSGMNSPSSQPPIFFPPPLVRPPTPNNWSSPPPSVRVPFGPPINQVPTGFCQPPPPAYCPPNPNNSQFFPNQFPSPISFTTPPPHVPYDKLNMPIQFTNPMMSFPNILPHPPPSQVPPQWQTNIPPPQVPIRLDNQQNNLAVPRSVTPGMANIPRIVSNCIPSPPPPPPVHQESSHPNYFSQPPPKF